MAAANATIVRVYARWRDRRDDSGRAGRPPWHPDLSFRHPRQRARDVGTLHTRSAELAIASAGAIEEPSDSALAERATSAVDALLADGQWLTASTMAGARQTRLNIARAYDPAAPPGRARRVARRAIADEDAVGQPQPRAQAPRAGRVAR